MRVVSSEQWAQVRAGLAQQPTFFWLGLGGLCPLVLFHWLLQSYLRIVMWPWLGVWQVGFGLILLALVAQLRQFQRPFRGLGYGLDGTIVIFLGAIVLSTLFAPFPALALWNSSRILCLVALLYWGRNVLPDDPVALKSALSWIWFGLISVGLGTGLVSFSQWRPSADMWLSDSFSDALRNHLPLGNNNFVGGYAVLLVPLAVTYPLAHQGWRRIWGGVAALVALALLYTSGSRGALLGAIVIVLAFGIIGFFSLKGKARLWLTLGSIPGLGLVALALISNPRIRQFFVTGDGWQGAITKVLQDGPIQDRILMLQSLGHLLLDRPWLGVGPGNMARVYNLYRPLEGGNWSLNVQQLHNTLAQVLGELGLLGAIAYVGSLGLVWGWSLQQARHCQTAQQRFLLWGTNVSLLAYSISSLTDYQLENLSITTVLVTLMVLWIGLMDSLDRSQDYGPFRVRHLQSPGPRKGISLGVLGSLGLCIVLWWPVDLATITSTWATRRAMAGDFVAADQGWNQAAQLVPWDPIYPVVAGQKLWQLSRTLPPGDDRDALVDQAMDYYQRAIAVAPNDALFTANLAVMALERNPALAVDAAERSVQLQNRAQFYGYYTLGLAYLATEQPEKAIPAFVLQALTQPSILTVTFQNDDRLAAIRPEVISRSLTLWDEFFQSTATLGQVPGQAGVAADYQIARWWNNYPPSELTDTILEAPRPLVQGLLLAETDPDRALEILTTLIESSPESNVPALLLRAWIDPDRYFDGFGATLTDPQTIDLWKTSITQERDLRSWLTSQTVQDVSSERIALWLTYRNMGSLNASQLFFPPGIVLSRIGQDLGLFQGLPRYYPNLDRLTNDYRTRQLGLPYLGTTGVLPGLEQS